MPSAPTSGRGRGTRDADGVRRHRQRQRAGDQLFRRTEVCGSIKALATAPNQKFVLMPMESSGIIGSIAGIAELAKQAAGKPDAPMRVPPMPPRAGD